MSAGHRRRRGKRVNFDGGAGRPGIAPLDWRCDADLEASPLDPADFVRVKGFDDKEDSTDAPEAPDVVLHFRAGDGGVVPASAAAVWHSPVVRDLVSHAGFEEEIPLPKCSTETLTHFLLLCELYPALPCYGDAACLRNANEEMLLGLCWVAKLLHIYTAMALSVADMLLVREHLVDVLPVDMLVYVVEHSLEQLGEETLLSIFDRIVSDRTGLIPPGRVVRLITPFMNDSNKVIREGALRSLQRLETLESQLVLLQHREFVVRAGALRYFRKCDPSENLVSAIARLASSRSFLIRESVAIALKVVAPAGNRLAVDVLVTMLKDNAREVRRAAAEGLKYVTECDDPDFVECMLGLVLNTSMSDPVRCEALSVLAVAAPSHTETIKELALTMQQVGSTMSKLYASRVLDMMQRTSDSDETLTSTLILRPGASRQHGSWADESD